MKNVSNESEPELDPRGKSDLHLSPSAAVSLNAMKETHGPSLEKSSFPPTLRPSSIGLLRSNQSSSFETNVRKARAGIRICNRFRQTRNSRGTNAVRDRLDTTGRNSPGIGREPSDSRRSSSTIPLLVIFGLVIYAGFFSARGDWHSRPIKNLEPIKTVPFAFKEKLNEQLSDLTLVVPEKHADRHDSSTASTCNYTDTFVEEDKPIVPKESTSEATQNETLKPKGSFVEDEKRVQNDTEKDSQKSEHPGIGLQSEPIVAGPSPELIEHIESTFKKACSLAEEYEMMQQRSFFLLESLRAKGNQTLTIRFDQKFRILMAMATLELFPVLLSHVDSLRLELGSAMNQLLPIPLIPCNDETSSPVDADTEELERIACETNGFWSRASQLRDEVMEILKNKTSIMNELETGDRLLNRVQRKQVAADAAEGCRRLMVENMAKNPFAEFNSAVLAMKNGTSNNPRVFDLARTRQDLLRLIWDGYNTRRNVFVGTKFEKLAESIPESANIVAMMQDEIDLMLQASKRVFRAGLNSQIMLERVLAQDQEFAEVLGKIDRLLAHRSTLNVLEDNLLKVKIAADRIGEPLGYNMALDTGKTQENSGYNVDSDQGGDCSLRNDQNEEEEEEDHHQKMTRDDCAELLRRKMGDICLPDCDRVQKEDQLIMIQRKIEILQKLNACVKDDFEQLGKYRLAYKNFKTMELGVQKKLLTSIGGIAHLLPMVRPDLQALNDDLENARREIEEQRTILSRMKVVQNKIIRESVIAANQLLTILNIADFPRDGLLTFRVNEVIHKVDQVEADIYCLKLLLESEEAPIECAAIIKRLVKEKTWPRDIPGNFTCSGLNNKNPLNPRKKKKVPKTSTVIVSEDKPNFKCLLSDSVTETRDETDDPFVPRKNNNEPDADNDHHANAFRQIFGNAKRLSDEFPANIGVKYSGDSRANLFPENPPLMVDEGGPSFQSKKAKTRETQVVEEISASCADQVCHTSKATASNNIHRPLSIFKTLKNDAKFWATGDGSTSRRFKAKKTDALPSLLGLESDFARFLKGNVQWPLMKGRSPSRIVNFGHSFAKLEQSLFRKQAAKTLSISPGHDFKFENKVGENVEARDESESQECLADEVQEEKCCDPMSRSSASHGVPSNKDEFVHNLDDADVSPRCGKQDHQDEDPCVDGTDEKCIALRRRQRYEFGVDGRAKVDPPKPLPPRESVQIPPASDIPSNKLSPGSSLCHPCGKSTAVTVDDMSPDKPRIDPCTKRPIPANCTLDSPDKPTKKSFLDELEDDSVEYGKSEDVKIDNVKRGSGRFDDDDASSGKKSVFRNGQNGDDDWIKVALMLAFGFFVLIWLLSLFCGGETPPPKIKRCDAMSPQDFFKEYLESEEKVFTLLVNFNIIKSKMKCPKCDRGYLSLPDPKPGVFAEPRVCSYRKCRAQFSVFHSTILQMLSVNPDEFLVAMRAFANGDSVTLCRKQLSELIGKVLPCGDVVKLYSVFQSVAEEALKTCRAPADHYGVSHNRERCGKFKMDGVIEVLRIAPGELHSEKGCFLVSERGGNRASGICALNEKEFANWLQKRVLVDKQTMIITKGLGNLLPLPEDSFQQVHLESSQNVTLRDPTTGASVFASVENAQQLAQDLQLILTGNGVECDDLLPIYIIQATWIRTHQSLLCSSDNDLFFLLLKELADATHLWESDPCVAPAAAVTTQTQVKQKFREDTESSVRNNARVSSTDEEFLDCLERTEPERRSSRRLKYDDDHFETVEHGLVYEEIIQEVISGDSPMGRYSARDTDCYLSPKSTSPKTKVCNLDDCKLESPKVEAHRSRTQGTSAVQSPQKSSTFCQTKSPERRTTSSGSNPIVTIEKSSSPRALENASQEVQTAEFSLGNEENVADDEEATSKPVDKPLKTKTDKVCQMDVPGHPDTNKNRGIAPQPVQIIPQGLAITCNTKHQSHPTRIKEPQQGTDLNMIAKLMNIDSGSSLESRDSNLSTDTDIPTANNSLMNPVSDTSVDSNEGPCDMPLNQNAAKNVVKKVSIVSPIKPRETLESPLKCSPQKNAFVTQRISGTCSTGGECEELVDVPITSLSSLKSSDNGKETCNPFDESDLNISQDKPNDREVRRLFESEHPMTTSSTTGGFFKMRKDDSTICHLMDQNIGTETTYSGLMESRSKPTDTDDAETSTLLPVRTLHPKALEKLLQDEETLQKTENRCHSDCLLEEDSPRAALSLQEGEKMSEQASESICQTEKVSKSKRRKSVNDERNKGGETVAISQNRETMIKTRRLKNNATGSSDYCSAFDHFPDRGKLIKDENLGKIPGNLSPMGSLSSNRLSSDSEVAWQLATFHQKSRGIHGIEGHPPRHTIGLPNKWGFIDSIDQLARVTTTSSSSCECNDCQRISQSFVKPKAVTVPLLSSASSESGNNFESVLSNVDDSSNPENTSSRSSSRKTTVIRTTFASRSILRKKTKEVPSLESQESLKYVRMLDADSGANLPALSHSAENFCEEQWTNFCGKLDDSFRTSGSMSGQRITNRDDYHLMFEGVGEQEFSSNSTFEVFSQKRRTSDSFSVDGKISLSKIEATTGSTNRSRSGRWIDPKRITVTRQEASPADIDSDTFSPNDEEEEPRPKTVGFEYWF